MPLPDADDLTPWPPGVVIHINKLYGCKANKESYVTVMVDVERNRVRLRHLSRRHFYWEGPAQSLPDEFYLR